MTKAGFTVYDLLISCPGDVEEFVDDIENAVDRFNRLFGGSHHMRVDTKYWKRDSYPQMGDKPQNILNRQFANNCDMVVAVFWTKFGTPTDRYGSGTEEEIENMISSRKQVFLYFLEKECHPSAYSSSYENVRKFKERCRQRGVYQEVSDEKELSEKFYDHLTQYFLENLNEKENISSNNTSGGVQSPHLAKGSDKEDKFLNNKREAIIRKIRLMQRDVLPGRERCFHEIPGTVSDAIIYRSQKELITEFAARNGIQIDPAFWNVGNLRRSVVGGGRVDVAGTEEEIKRYDEIKELCRGIEEFNRYKRY